MRFFLGCLLLALVGVSRSVREEEDEEVSEKNGGDLMLAHGAADEHEDRENVVSEANGEGEAALRPMSRTANDAKLTLLQFNMLADGLAIDGFLSPRDFVDKNNKLHEDTPEQFYTRVHDTVQLITKAKADIKANGNGKQTLSKDYIEKFAAKAGFTKDGKVFSRSERDLEEESERKTVSWEDRGKQIVGMIMKLAPDIVTFQEIDQYTYLAEALGPNYTSVRDGGLYNKYANQKLMTTRLANLENYKNATYANQVEELALQGIAFAPNFKSNARKFALRRLVGLDDPKLLEEGRKDDLKAALKKLPLGSHDDQGVAIFWKKDKFKLMQEPEVAIIGTNEKSDAAGLKVVLTTKGTKGQSGHKVAVVTTHLSSGPEKELRRHGELNDVHTHLIKDEKNPLIFAGDLNSEIWFDKTHMNLNTTCFDLVTGQPGESQLKERKKVKEVSLSQWNMNSVWREAQESKTKQDDLGVAPPTVLKMRGPASNQPHKMGGLALETIDHIFYSNIKFVKVEVVGHFDQNPMEASKLPKMTKAQLVAFRNAINEPSKEATGKWDSLSKTPIKDILFQMLPNKVMPSDHFPVFATFEFKGRAVN